MKETTVRDPELAVGAETIEPTITATNNGEDNKEAGEETQKKQASMKEIFSFAKTTKVKLLIFGAFSAAIVSGLVMPGMFGQKWIYLVHRRLQLTVLLFFFLNSMTQLL